MLLMIPFTRYISQKLKAIQNKLMIAKDHRINTSSEALEGIKLIKLQAWERKFLERISDLRAIELKILRKYSFGWQFHADTSGCKPSRNVCGTRLPTSCPP